jgi:penicillin-binding protein 2
MDDNRIYEDMSRPLKRSRAVFVAVEALCAFVLFFYWKIQILDHGKYWAMSEANRTRDVVLPAPRAVITDRSGQVILADSIASFKASIIRENTRNLDESYERVGRLIGLDPAVVRSRIEKFRMMPLFKPIVVKDNLSLEEVARIEVRKMEFPELVIETEPKRFYPFGSLASHLIGYLQELTTDELRTTFKDRRLGDMTGRTGVERSSESRIVGVDGKIVEIVDSLGRKRDEAERVEPRQSPKLILTLDYDLQAKAEQLLAGREGAIIVLDPRTGGILALANYPTFDPNKFINRFTPEEWTTLAANPDHPLLSRAIQGLYPPGSIFKLVMATAALSSGTIVPQTVFTCDGEVEIYGRIFHCLGVHGPLNLYEAIRHSCNIYFYNLGRRMNIDAIADYAGRMGLGRKTGIDLPNEIEGTVPSTEWKQRTQKAPWYPGETISVAIGQGPLQVTPVQIAAMTAMIANRGTRVHPHLIAEAPAQTEFTDIPASVFEDIIDGMWRSTNKEGTSRAAFIDGFDVCGKTGSVETISRETAERLGIQRKTHSWFSGFAPRRGPEIVVTVLVEFGGRGGEASAPIAHELFSLYKAKIHDRPIPSSRD